MDEKRAADDAVRYREALSMIEQMQPMADKLYDWRIDPNGRLRDALDVFQRTCSDIIEALSTDALAEGLNDLSRDGGRMFSDRRPLDAKARGAHSVYR
jgi:hypothetical protein